MGKKSREKRHRRSGPKIYLGCITWRQYESLFVTSLVELIRREPGIVFDSLPGDALVARARARVATLFLRSDCDVLLTIDSDIWFQAEDAIQVCEQAMNHSIVCGAYSMRGGGILSVAGLEGRQYDFNAGPEPVEVLWSGNGFLATHRRVFEAMLEADPEGLALCQPGTPLEFHPFYSLFTVDDSLDGHLMLSEDFAFCERARRLGFPTYLNPAVRLGHVGTKVYTLLDAP